MNERKITHRVEMDSDNDRSLLILTDGVHTRTAQFEYLGPTEADINEQWILALEQFEAMPLETELQDRRARQP